MSTARFFGLATLTIFVSIGTIGYFKKQKQQLAIPEQSVVQEEQSIFQDQKIEEVEEFHQIASEEKGSSYEEDVARRDSIDRIRYLFTTGPAKLPIVETVRYTSRVPWLKGRPAWITDYASYYKTSRHFIARSLNGRPDYYTQKIASGNKFNVFRLDKNVQFYLVVDISRLKMHFYYLDLDSNERVLLKTYPVGVGRIDKASPSGCLTPTGIYRLGDKVAIYKPGIMGYFQDQEVEMVKIFGTRWIPFDEEVDGCYVDARGYGIHGAPWYEKADDGSLVEDTDSVCKFTSDGCIRLRQVDMEELFSVVISKPTIIHIVKNFEEATLPGVEVDPLPSTVLSNE